MSRLSRRRLLAGSGVTLLGFGSLVRGGSRRVRAGSDTTAETDGVRADDRTRTASIDVSLDGLESFVDDRMEAHVEEHDVVGASVAVVRDDEIVLANGYGETDTGSETPVAADETLFRFGSISKPIVWTAVMGLIEDGRIDPHEDVRTYLESVSIPEAHGEPITVAHLATHTAGFEERFRGTWVDDPDERRSLPDVLSEEQPERVRPPGDAVSYSNYGAALAAQVVADVTGTPFEEYAETELFDPLGMDRSTFEQPTPDDLAADAATGYSSLTGTPVEAPGLALELAPAGALSATVTDVARLVRAHLGDGASVLEAETLDRFHDRWFTHHEALDGVAFGLFEDTRGGVRTLWHNGHIPGSFYAYLLLVPAADLAIVLAYNTDGGQTAAIEFRDAFLEEYLPLDDEGEAPAPDGQPERADDLAGTYRGTQVAESTMARLPSTLQAGSVDVSVDDDGYLVTDFGGGPNRWVERDPLVFEDRDGEATLAFGGTDGEITRLFVEHQAFERISRRESLSFHAGIAGATMLGMLSGAVGWPLARGWRWLRDTGSTGSEPVRERESDSSQEASVTTGVDFDDDGNGADETGSGSGSSSSPGRLESLASVLSPTRARWIAVGAIASLFGFLVGTVVVYVFNPYTLFSSPQLGFQAVSLLTVVGSIGAALAAVCALQAWRERWWRLPSRLHYTLVVLAMAGFCWLLAYWNFLGLPL